MPYRTSSPESEADALAVVEALGCRTERVDISPMVDPMLALIEGDEAATRVRRGNVMARQRMIVLYDRSAAFDALVIGTSNKTEALLGYGTLWGDMAAAIQPIGDLYKSQLRAVAECLGVPERILAKPPSADLWPGQTDETELGASYDDLDRILYALVDRRWSQDRCVRAGLDAGAGGSGGRHGGADGVQAPGPAGRQGQPAHAGDRPPLPAAPSRLAPREL